MSKIKLLINSQFGTVIVTSFVFSIIIKLLNWGPTSNLLKEVTTSNFLNSFGYKPTSRYFFWRFAAFLVWEFANSNALLLADFTHSTNGIFKFEEQWVLSCVLAYMT